MALGAYLWLAPPVSGDADSSEFTLALALAGVPHPTGYPIYTMAGHLFGRALHALGAGWPYAANAWSALGAAVAVLMLHRLAIRLVPDRPELGSAGREMLATVPPVLLALNSAWLMVATVAEVHSWHVAWVCGAAWLGLRLLDAPAGDGPGARSTTAMAALWGLTCGLGAAHHATSALVSVVFSVVLALAYARRRALRAAHFAAAVAAALAPLASYSFVAWRAWHPADYQWPSLAPSLASVIEHVTGARYRHFLGRFAPAPEEWTLIASSVLPFLSLGAAALVAVSAGAAGRRERLPAAMLLAAVIAQTLYAFQYGVYDVSAYFLPALALGLAGLAPVLARIVAALPGGPGIRALAVAALAALSLAGSAGLGLRSGLEARSRHLEWDDTVREMWASIPSSPAIVLWPADSYARLIEYQVLGREKPALFVENPMGLADDFPRARFQARFGVDPLEGLDVAALAGGSGDEARRIERIQRAIAVNVNRQTPTPVIYFDPAGMRLVRLRKPWEIPPSPGDG